MAEKYRSVWLFRLGTGVQILRRRIMKLQDFVQDKPILETKQLTLRPLRKEDVADLKEWLGDNSAPTG